MHLRISFLSVNNSRHSFNIPLSSYYNIIIILNCSTDKEGKENVFLSTDVGRFGGYPLSNWLAKHFPVEDDGIKLYIDLPLIKVTKVRLLLFS
jgi:hypothetical protein